MLKLYAEGDKLIHDISKTLNLLTKEWEKEEVCGRCGGRGARGTIYGEVKI